MEDYITVNGARIERSFFEENVAEARQCQWASEHLALSGDHHHCIICGIALSEGLAFRCSHKWLCEYCHNNFVNRK